MIYYWNRLPIACTHRRSMSLTAPYEVYTWVGALASLFSLQRSITFSLRLAIRTAHLCNMDCFIIYSSMDGTLGGQQIHLSCRYDGPCFSEYRLGYFQSAHEINHSFCVTLCGRRFSVCTFFSLGSRICHSRWSSPIASGTTRKAYQWAWANVTMCCFQRANVFGLLIFYNLRARVITIHTTTTNAFALITEDISSQYIHKKRKTSFNVSASNVTQCLIFI